MPNLDHKGPEGLGPKTGKKQGKCRKNETEKKEILESGHKNLKHSCRDGHHKGRELHDTKKV